MAFTCGFFNSVAHDRKYDAVQHGMIFDGIITDGIYATYLKAMVVKASENASEVIVQPGRAWFNHTWSYNDSDYPVAAPEPEVVLDRIDTLVLDVNSEDAVRNNQFLWVQGTPTSQTPEPPELIHTATHNQYPLCDVYRQAGTTMIYAADITNRVGTSDCPFVTGVLESIDIDDLLAQWDDEFHTWENATKASFEGWMLNQQSVYTAWFNALKTQMAGDVADVEAWVQTIKDIIDEETATHLQLEIDEIKSMLPSGSHITVTTSDTELYSRTVTITDEDNNTVTSQFDANGVAVFKTVPYVGNLTITSTDGVRTATEVVNTPYFARYEFTLAFWSATVNIIGDSVFGGDTVTITDSTTALVGTVVLNASGAGIFNATYPDTYKFSVTHGGETMEVSLAVTQETTYNVEIHSGLNYQAWLNAGRVSKSFSSLDEVLEDEKTLRQLFLVHDAVDYVASQRVNNDLTKIFNTDLAAKWINNSDYALEHFYAVADIKTVMDAADKYGYGEWTLIPQVPKMTSNTAPFGTASASTTYDSSWAAWKAFDGVVNNPNDAWSTTHYNTSNQYLRYAFPNPVSINEVEVQSHATYCAKNCKIQYSNDGITWNDAEEFTIARSDAINKIKLATPITAQYWGLYIVDSYTNEYLYIQHLQFYAWAPKGNVPVMTANNAPFGKASASTELSYGGHDFKAWKAFNNAISPVSDNSWLPTSGSTNNRLSYNFVAPTLVKKVKLVVSGNSFNNFTATFTIHGSNDGTTWSEALATIISESNTSSTHSVYEVNLNNENYYAYYSLFTSDVIYSSSREKDILSLQFYGRELKVSVPTMTSNTAPFGTAVSSIADSGYEAFKAFDNNDTTYFCPPSNTTAEGTYIGYIFPTPMKLQQIRYRCTGGSGTITMAKVQYSDDGGTTWNDQTTSFNYSIDDTYHVVNIENASPHKAWRVYKISASTANSFAHKTLQFYGEDYSEKEFEEGTTKRWLYDHGVELVDFETTKGSTTTSAVPYNDGSEIHLPTLAGSSATTLFSSIGVSMDLSNFSLVRAAVGTRLKATGSSSVNPGEITAWNNKPTTDYNNFTRIASTNFLPFPLQDISNFSLDVSSVNSTVFLGVFMCYYAGRECSIKELWLE